jgi:hypothetical protein
MVGIQLVNHYRPVDASVAGQVSLAITIDIQFSNPYATDDGTLPDAGADGFTAPSDLARKTDVNRYKPWCHFVVLVLVLEKVGVGNLYFRSNLPMSHPQRFFIV